MKEFLENITVEQIKAMSLYEKLFYIGAEIEPIKKKHKDPESDFSFDHVTSDMVLGEVKSLLIKYKILLLPNTTNEEFQYLQGKKNCCYSRLSIKYTIINIDNIEEKQIFDCVGHGVDSGERCVGKAYTYAEKYFLLKLFNIPTPKDDPDNLHNQGSGPNTENEETEILKILFYKIATKKMTKEEINKIASSPEEVSKIIDNVCQEKTKFKGKNGKEVKGITLQKLNSNHKRLKTTYKIVSEDNNLKEIFDYAVKTYKERQEKNKK